MEIANDFDLEAEDEKILDIKEQPEVQVGNIFHRTLKSFFCDLIIFQL